MNRYFHYKQTKKGQEMTKQDGLQATKSQIIIHRSPLFFTFAQFN